MGDAHTCIPPERTRALLLTLWNGGEAVVIRQLLASYGIPCQVESEIPYSLLPVCLSGLSEIRILVFASSLDEARRLLAEHRRHGLRVLRGGRAPLRRLEVENGMRSQSRG